jgi:hypothetical protein
MNDQGGGQGNLLRQRGESWSAVEFPILARVSSGYQIAQEFEAFRVCRLISEARMDLDSHTLTVVEMDTGGLPEAKA